MAYEADYTRIGSLRADRHVSDIPFTEDIKTLENAADAHTRDNRDKRKALQERRTQLGNGMAQLSHNMQEGQRALNGLYQSVEASLQLATHAEGWEWKEAASEQAD